METIKATIAHVKKMAPIVREADRMEILAATNETPEQALLDSLERSSMAKTMLADGEIIGMFGLVPASILSGVNVAWFISTENLEKYKMSFARSCRKNRKNLYGLKEHCDILVNYVDARYKTSLIWLEWLGFTIHESESFGAHSLPFHRITMEVS